MRCIGDAKSSPTATVDFPGVRRSLDRKAKHTHKEQTGASSRQNWKTPKRARLLGRPSVHMSCTTTNNMRPHTIIYENGNNVRCVLFYRKKSVKILFWPSTQTNKNIFFFRAFDLSDGLCWWRPSQKWKIFFNSLKRHTVKFKERLWN